MKFEQLEAFVALAEELHFGHAAQRRMVTTSALSKQIHDLERSIGVRLFDRSTRRAILTPAGQLLLENARRTLHEANNFEELAKAAAAGHAGRVTLAHTVSHADFLMRLLRETSEALPGVEIDFREWPGHKIAQAVRDHAFDLGLTSSATETGLEHFKFDAIVFDTVLVAQEHRFASKDAIASGDLEGETFLLAGADPSRVWESKGIAVHVRHLEYSSREELANRIERGDGIAFVSSATLSAFQHRALHALALRDPEDWGHLDQFLVWRADNDSPVVGEVARIVRALAGRMPCGQPSNDTPEQRP